MILKKNSKRSYTHSHELVLCALFAALVAVGAFIRVPLWLVPLTLQSLFTTLAGLLLGSRLGAASIGVYLLIGLSGVPVFTQGGGLSYVLQPSFGYLLGFLAGAFAAGKMMEVRPSGGFVWALLAAFLNLAIIYIIGILYMYAITSLYLRAPLGLQNLLWKGMLTPLPGDLLKSVLAAWLAVRLRPFLRGGAHERASFLR